MMSKAVSIQGRLPDGARARAAPSARSFQAATAARQLRRVAPAVRAATGTDNKAGAKDKELVEQIGAGLKGGGMDRAAARAVLKQWQEAVGHEVTPDALRKILTGQSSKAVGFVLFSTLLDGASAYVAYNAAVYLSLAQPGLGGWAVAGQAATSLLCGYFLAGAAFDLFKLGAVVTASYQFRVNSAAYLAAVEDIAGASASATGLAVADKALGAANSVKVLQALGKMADLLREAGEAGGGAGETRSGGDMLNDLETLLTLRGA
jgi:hypothetical protein